MRNRKRILIIGLAAILVLGLAAIPVAYPLAKIIRSKQHLEAAIRLKEDGDDRTAYFKIQSAYNLNPENGAIASLLGPYGAAVWHPAALDWWLAAAERGLLDTQEMREMIEYGLRTGQARKVRPYLYQVSRLNPEDPELQTLQVRLLQQEQDLAGTFGLARDLVEKGNLSLEVVSAYLQGAFRIQVLGPDEKDKALDLARQLARETGELGQFAGQFMLRSWQDLEEADKAALAQRITGSPDFPFADQLRLLSLLKRDGDDPDEILSRARAVWQDRETSGETDDGTADLVIMADWLNGEGYHETVLELITDEMTDGQEGLFLAYQVALIGTDQAREAYNRSLESNPLSPTRNLVVRALALSNLGEPEGIQETLSLAAESVQPAEILWLERILNGSGLFALSVDMFEKLEKSLPDPTAARGRLLQYYYRDRQEAQLTALLRRFLNPQLDTLSVEKTLHLYLSLLYQVDLPATRSQLEELVRELPSVAEFRVLLAFAYSLSGSNEAALALLEEGISGLEKAPQRFVRIMLARIHLAAGDRESAAALIEQWQSADLLAQEKALLSSLI